jgi:hypothetical protein
MTDQQIWNIFIYGGSWLLSLIGTVWLIAWGLVRYTTSGEIRELKERCNVLEQRRQLAEDQQKATANELTNVKAQLVTAQDQLEAHAPAEAISGTIKTIQTSTYTAISSNNEVGRMLRVITPTDVRLHAVEDLDDPKK